MKKILKTAIKKPISTIIHGQEGIGKSTFATSGEGVILLPTEPSSDMIEGVERFDRAGVKSWPDIMECMEQVVKSDYKIFA